MVVADVARAGAEPAHQSVESADRSPQAALFERLERMPVQAGEAIDMVDG